MTKRLPKKGDLIMTANYVSGYDLIGDEPSTIINQLAIVTYARETTDKGQVVRVRLLANNKTLVLFEDEYTYPEEQDDAGG